MRFLHTSDWQLGMTRAFLTPEASARFSKARIDAIVTLGRLASEHEARFIVVAGDVFESNQISRETLVRTLEAQVVSQLMWNGENDSGETAASGVYFLRIETDSGETTRSVAGVK